MDRFRDFLWKTHSLHNPFTFSAASELIAAH